MFDAYAQSQEAVGRWGAAGFLTTVVGILLVRSSRAVPGLAHPPNRRFPSKIAVEIGQGQTWVRPLSYELGQLRGNRPGGYRTRLALRILIGGVRRWASVLAAP